MVQLQEDLEEIKKAGLQLVAISYDSLEILSKYAESNGIEYPLLSVKPRWPLQSVSSQTAFSSFNEDPSVGEIESKRDPTGFNRKEYL